MLDFIASVLFQLAALFAGETTATTPTQTKHNAPETRTEVSTGGTGGWTGGVTASGGTGGWTGGATASGGTGGWTGGITASGGSSN